MHIIFSFINPEESEQAASDKWQNVLCMLYTNFCAVIYQVMCSMGSNISCCKPRIRVITAQYLIPAWSERVYCSGGFEIQHKINGVEESLIRLLCHLYLMNMKRYQTSSTLICAAFLSFPPSFKFHGHV